MKRPPPKGGPYFRGAEPGSNAWWFEWIGEFRSPNKGEYYLSGADPVAWRALGDFQAEYYIMRKVDGPRKEVIVDGLLYRLVEPLVRREPR